MKKIFSFLLVCALLLTGCGIQSEPAPSADVSPFELAQNILSTLGKSAGELRCLNELYDSEALEEYIGSLYGLSAGAWSDCALYLAGGAEVFEVSVFRLTGSMSEKEAAEALEAYQTGRVGDFFGYAPDQAAIAEGGVILLSEDGAYAAVLLCPDADLAADAFYAALKQERAAVAQATPEPSTEPAPEATPTESGREYIGEVLETPGPTESPETGRQYPSYWLEFIPPNLDDMSLYDNSTILAALESGSSEGLNKKEKQLYARTAELLDELIDEGMSDYEKEWAVYSWLIDHVDYDWTHYDNTTVTPRDSYRPYGAIVNNTAVCLGYATAFQLFMDALDIECITVVGAAFHSGGDHAWNMVRLDREWYCVDATWDTGNGAAMENCSYFNVTSDWMALTDHQWDYENTPLATADFGRSGTPAA